MKRMLFALVLLHFCTIHQVVAQTPQNIYHIPDDLYQFSSTVQLQQPDGKFKTSVNYLWVPPNAKKLRAIIISSQNVLEQWLDEHPIVRNICIKNDIGILFSCPGFFIENKDRTKDINGKNIQMILDTLSNLSGYSEISSIPWICIGHSGTNNLVRELLRNYSSKILTAFTNKGGPGLENPQGVPVMCTAGEYFEWSQHKEELIKPFDTIKNYLSVMEERKQQQAPLSYFFDPNTGHFECSERLTVLIANYIDAAFKARLGKNSESLIPIDVKSGWVAGLPLPGGKLVKPKLYKDANEEERNLPWYFNKQQAENAIELANVNFKRIPQIAGFSNLDGTVAGFNRGIVWPIPYETQEDGITFDLKPVFWTAIPDTFKNAKTPLQKSNNTPHVILLCGNAKHLKDNSFEIYPGRSYKSSATYFIVRTEGDATFRSNVEPGQLVLKPNENGMQQIIQFPTLKNITSKEKSLALQATSSSGLPVKFFVNSGPAIVQNNNLVLTKIPVKAKYPVKITIVAYQWGRSKSPVINTAPFVEQNIFIEK